MHTFIIIAIWIIAVLRHSTPTEETKDRKYKKQGTLKENTTGTIALPLKRTIMKTRFKHGFGKMDAFKSMWGSAMS